jgi:hypothetical protein
MSSKFIGNFGTRPQERFASPAGIPTAFSWLHIRVIQINTISLNTFFFTSLSDTASLAGHTKWERPWKVSMDVHAYKKEESNCLEQGTDGLHLLDSVLIMLGKSKFKAWNKY